LRRARSFLWKGGINQSRLDFFPHAPHNDARTPSAILKDRDMQRLLASAGLVAALLLGAALPTAADDEVAPGVPDSARIARSIVNPELPLEEPEVLWKFISETVVKPDGTTYMVGVGEPAIADSVIYFGNDNGRLFALAADDGRELWTHDHGSRIYWAPAVDKDHVYIESDLGFTALDRRDGRELWRHAVKSGGAAPVVHGKRVYVSGNDGIAYALDRVTGQVLWKHSFVADAPPDQEGFEGKRARIGENPARPCGAACDGELLVQCVFDQSRVIALDCETGERRWTFQTGGWMWPKPTITSDRVYFASQDAHFYCLDRKTGELLWKFKTPGWFQTVAAVADGKVFVAHHRGRLFQLDELSGNLLATFEPDDAEKSLGGSSVLLGDATAYYTITKGQIYAVDTGTNALRWKLRPSQHSELALSPVTDGHRIFLSMRQNLEHQGEAGIVAIGARR